ncbi:hypothetical protein OJ998_07330 [Solirubrobacter taibaiensis]|nr:hypothetical protein [Solirubrobacter taibaiensis]
MRLKLVGLAAAALLATPAAAPASSIEHTVRTVTFEASYTVEGVVPRSERVERWVAYDRAHQVIKTSSTGLLRYEAAQEPQKFTAFDAVRNEVWTLQGAEADTPRGTFVRSLADEGADIKTSVAQGWLVKTGDTTFLGRPAIKLESASNAPGEGNSKMTVVADATTYAPYERVVTGRERGETFKQREVVESIETLALADNEHFLYMGPGSARAKRVTSAEAGKAALGESKKKKAKKSKKKSRR